MYRLDKPDEVKHLDDLDLVRMTRYEVLKRYGVLPMHYRAQVIREQVLTAEVLSDLIRQALGMPGGVREGRLVWEALLPLVPLQPHGLDVWDVRRAAEEVLRTEEQRYESPNGAWWWRLRVVHGIEDPVGWVVEQAEKGERSRVVKMVYGEAGKGKTYLLIRRCREYLARRKRRKQGGKEQAQG